MGFYMANADIFVGSVLAEMNLRFAPAQEPGQPEWFGGIEEMAAVQKEFHIFKKGRPLQTSLRALNLSPNNPITRQRWLRWAEALSKHSSNRTGENGNQAIVNALLDNFASACVLPVFFSSYDMGGKPEAQSPVLITRRARPVHYLEQDYLLITLPMQSREAAARSREYRAWMRQLQACGLEQAQD